MRVSQDEFYDAWKRIMDHIIALTTRQISAEQTVVALNREVKRLNKKLEELEKRLDKLC